MELSKITTINDICKSIQEYENFEYNFTTRIFLILPLYYQTSEKRYSIFVNNDMIFGYCIDDKYQKYFSSTEIGSNVMFSYCDFVPEINYSCKTILDLTTNNDVIYALKKFEINQKCIDTMFSDIMQKMSL